MQKKLIVIEGPTAVGKTEYSLHVAEELHTEIVSCDSRQMFREMKIGTAAPTVDELVRVPHHFVGNLSIHDYYSCGKFEIEALQTLEKLFQTHDSVVMTGGSMLYIDAVCKGIDEVPNIDENLRASLWNRFQNEGLDTLCEELRRLDPEYAQIVDLKNGKRIIHALEICLQTGKTYTEIRKNEKKVRPFDIEKIGIFRPREELNERINGRVDNMMDQGLLEEVKNLYPYKSLNSLNTVGYRELFDYMDGIYTLEEAVEKIKTNTRRYAKKQMTWFKKDDEVTWIDPTTFQPIEGKVCY